MEALWVERSVEKKEKSPSTEPSSGSFKKDFHSAPLNTHTYNIKTCEKWKMSSSEELFPFECVCIREIKSERTMN